MKTLLIVLLCSTSLFAEEINFYVVNASLVSKVVARNIANLGRKDKFQPFRECLLLTPLNTNYYLISNPPSEIETLVSLGHANLYQKYVLENHRVRLAVDNSSIYELEKDWAYFKESSGTAASQR